MKTGKMNWLLGLFLVILSVACSKKEATGVNDPGNAHVTVKMVDGPGDYEAVWIDVKDVMVSSSDTDGGWISLAGIQPGIYNLLELTNGIDTVLADGEIPAGRINQIRLVLGDSNSVVVDGVSYHLETPSAQQSGLKLKLNTTLVAGANYVFTLDFDAGKSIVETGGGKFQLKPVIKVFVETEGGTIVGSLNPPMVAYLTAVKGSEEYSTYSNDSGQFLLQGLPAGTYDLLITPPVESGYGDKTIENIQVIDGQTANVGVIDL